VDGFEKEIGGFGMVGSEGSVDEVFEHFVSDEGVGLVGQAAASGSFGPAGWHLAASVTGGRLSNGGGFVGLSDGGGGRWCCLLV
jgi:hypothetical protein